MSNFSSQRGLSTGQAGFATAAVVIAVVVVLVGAGAVYYFSVQSAREKTQREDTAMMEKKDAMMQKDALSTPAAGEIMMKKEGEAVMEKESMVKYSGTVLAGTSAQLLDFNKADFDAAIQSDKVVVLYFFANWCPICAEEFPKMQAAFNQLTTNAVVGFRVNYNDNQTDVDETALAREHGVAYQHTKVFIKNGQQILKSPETWNQDRYLTEINKTAR